MPPHATHGRLTDIKGDDHPTWQSPSLQNAEVVLPKSIHDTMKEFAETIAYTNPTSGTTLGKASIKANKVAEKIPAPVMKDDFLFVKAGLSQLEATSRDPTIQATPIWLCRATSDEVVPTSNLSQRKVSDEDQFDVQWCPSFCLPRPTQP
jgi:hypothetical protein